MNKGISTRYSITRDRLVCAELEEPTAVGRRPSGSQPPPAARRGPVHVARVGQHQLEVQRDGEVVTIALPGALRLRGEPAQIRALVAALQATIDG